MAVRIEHVVSFNVFGLPKGKARPRVTKTGHAYTPAATVAWENTIRLQVTHAMRGVELPDGNLIVRMTFFSSRRKATPKSGENCS